jgi:hypothetical protein
MLPPGAAPALTTEMDWELALALQPAPRQVDWELLMAGPPTATARALLMARQPPRAEKQLELALAMAAPQMAYRRCGGDSEGKAEGWRMGMQPAASRCCAARQVSMPNKGDKAQLAARGAQPSPVRWRWRWQHP